MSRVKPAMMTWREYVRHACFMGVPRQEAVHDAFMFYRYGELLPNYPVPAIPLKVTITPRWVEIRRMYYTTWVYRRWKLKPKRQRRRYKHA